MDNPIETFTVTFPGRVLRITINKRELASTMAFRLGKSRASYKGGRTTPKRVRALEGGVVAEWVER